MDFESYEQIMAPSAFGISDYLMGTQFPSSDFAGWFLFAACTDDGPVQAINVGMHVGLPDGSEAGMSQWRPDVRGTVVICSVIVDGVSYRWHDNSSYTRDDVIYLRDAFDVQIANVGRIKGTWPEYSMLFHDPVNDVTVDIVGQARHVVWVPDHFYTTQLHSYALLPDYSFTGTVTVKGTRYSVAGTGGLDHLVGRFQGSPSKARVGYWHYDPIVWDNGLVSAGLSHIDVDGVPVVSSGFSSLPDCGWHPSDNFHVWFHKTLNGTANAGSVGASQPVPREWSARMRMSHGELVYVARARDAVDPEGKALVEPNVVFDAVGEFTGNDGHVQRLVGRGHNEYMGGATSGQEVPVPNELAPLFADLGRISA